MNGQADCLWGHGPGPAMLWAQEWPLGTVVGNAIIPPPTPTSGVEQQASN